MFRSLVIFFLCGGVAMAQNHPSNGRCAAERAEVKKLQGWVNYDKGAKSPDLDVNVAKLASATSALEKCRSDATAKEETSRSGPDSNQNASGYGLNFPSFVPPPVLRMPEINIPPMPQMKPIPVQEFHYVSPKQLYRVVPTPPPFGTSPSTQPGFSSGCSDGGASREQELQQAEMDLNQKEFNLRDLQFRYQNATIAAQNAAQAAANSKGVWAGVLAGFSVIDSLAAIKLSSEARNLEVEVNLAQLQVNMARSSVDGFRFGGNTDSLNCRGPVEGGIEPLSADALKMLKTLGTQCFRGGDLNSLIASAASNPVQEPRTSLDHKNTTPANINPVASHQATTAAASVDGIAKLSDVEAAVYRPDKSDLLLIGSRATEKDAISPDDWAVAYRSVLGTEPLGISIDPGPSSTEMVVRYLGGSQGTHLGSTLFEADRTLKILSSGFDNFSCSAWPSMPHDLPSELDLMEVDLQSGTEGPKGWHRFWFEPPDEPVRITRDGHGIKVPDNRWVVREESVPAGRPSSPSARKFAENLSGEFPQLRQSIPAFAELHRVASLVYVAKWIRDQQIPGEAAWTERSVEAVATPRTTPSVAVLKGAANGRSFLRYGIRGGVDFYAPNRYQSAAPETEALIQKAKQAEINGYSSWDFSLEGKRHAAIRLRYHHPVQPGPNWVATPRSEITMEQPAVQRMELPVRHVQITNETTQPFHIDISGPTQKTIDLQTIGTTTVELIPGTYEVTATTANCETKTTSIDLTDANRQVTVSCQEAGTVVSPIR